MLPVSPCGHVIVHCPGNLPPPTTPDEVGARMLNQERYERGEIAVSVSFCLFSVVSHYLERDRFVHLVARCLP